MRIKYIKKAKNAQADILNKKSGYKDNRKPKDFIIFQKNKNNLVLNKNN
jgi:hypothetical protein